MSDRRDFIRQLGFGAAGIGLISVLPSCSITQKTADRSGSSLPRSTPEQQGVSSQAINRFLDAVKASGQEFHSLMIVRHGHVIAEGWWSPYSAAYKQQTYSLSKSFTSTAVGLALEEKLLSVDDPVTSFFPSLLPEPVSENLASLKVKHLLTMSVGHEKDSILLLEQSPSGTPWVRTFLNLPVVEKPGTRFMYNSGASFMLSAIVQKVTGMTAHDYLKKKLFDQMGITGSTWTTNPDGINMGASHLRLRTEDMAKFGQLFLQRGRWNGRQLLSKAWVADASARQIATGKNDSSWGYGYGYQFWLNPPGGFRADGAFGQYTMIFPQQVAVVTITSESLSTKITMQLVWDHLVPEMSGKAALPVNSPVTQQLAKNLKALAHDPPSMLPTSPIAAALSGKDFVLENNVFNAKSISFTFLPGVCVFTLTENGKPDIIIRNGINQWVHEGNYKPSPHSLFSQRRIDFDSIVAASATWIDQRTLLLTWRFIETVHSDSLMCVFDGNEVNIRLLFSVARLQLKPDDRQALTGKIVS